MPDGKYVLKAHHAATGSLGAGEYAGLIPSSVLMTEPIPASIALAKKATSPLSAPNSVDRWALDRLQAYRFLSARYEVRNVCFIMTCSRQHALLHVIPSMFLCWVWSAPECNHLSRAHHSLAA